MLADYGQLLAHDPDYAERAKVVSGLAKDIGQFLAGEDLTGLDCAGNVGPVAVHTPCTLYHGLREPALVESLLERLGFELAPTSDKHLCCGSAGTYSVLQPAASKRLRERKLKALSASRPAVREQTSRCRWRTKRRRRSPPETRCSDAASTCGSWRRW